MSKFFNYICDFSVEESPGGAEKCDDALLKDLYNLGFEHNFVPATVNGFTAFNQDLPSIVSNRSKWDYQFLKDALSFKPYIVLEHDYQILVHRNPYHPEPYLSQRNPIEFYQNAHTVIFQSKFQQYVFNELAKTELPNAISFGTPFFGFNDLKIYERFSEHSVNVRGEKAIILNSKNAIKGTNAAVDFCENNDIPYELFPKNLGDSYTMEEWREILLQNSAFCFMPQYPESFSRVLLEAALAGCGLLTTPNSGFFHWYKNLTSDGDYIKIIPALQKSRETWLSYLTGVLDGF